MITPRTRRADGDIKTSITGTKYKSINIYFSSNILKKMNWEDDEKLHVLVHFEETNPRYLMIEKNMTNGNGFKMAKPIRNYRKITLKALPFYTDNSFQNRMRSINYEIVDNKLLLTL